MIRLRFPGKKTMRVAQELYEGIDVDGSGPVGLITYMRTDSLRVSDEAVTAVRDRIKTEFGEQYLPAKPIRYAAGKLAQEAHEAIRPTELQPHAGADQAALDPRSVPPLSAHLQPISGQPDGPCRLHGHRRRNHGRAPGCSRRRARSRSSTATAACGRSTASTTTSCLPALAVGQALDLHQPRRDAALHPAPAAVQRGDADQGAGKGGDRSPEHLRADHPDDSGSRLRRAERAAVPRHDFWAWPSTTCSSNSFPRSST